MDFLMANYPVIILHLYVIGHASGSIMQLIGLLAPMQGFDMENSVVCIVNFRYRNATNVQEQTECKPYTIQFANPSVNLIMSLACFLCVLYIQLYWIPAAGAEAEAEDKEEEDDVATRAF